ncbi:hypothetical protein Ccrd_026233, partial [Cynara cardunculus var. scolymus]
TLEDLLAIPSSSSKKLEIIKAGRHAVELYILKALQIDRSYSENPSVIQPCVTVLRCLNGSLYGGFKREIQELLFQGLLSFFNRENHIANQRQVPRGAAVSVCFKTGLVHLEQNQLPDTFPLIRLVISSQKICCSQEGGDRYQELILDFLISLRKRRRDSLKLKEDSELNVYLMRIR